MVAGGFAQAAPGAIADNGVPDLPGRREARAGRRARRRPIASLDDQVALPLGQPVRDEQELATQFQPLDGERLIILIRIFRMNTGI
jgi:hypothetical protein